MKETAPCSWSEIGPFRRSRGSSCQPSSTSCRRPQCSSIHLAMLEFEMLSIVCATHFPYTKCNVNLFAEKKNILKLGLLHAMIMNLGSSEVHSQAMWAWHQDFQTL